jgi:hypothetical protein
VAVAQRKAKTRLQDGQRVKVLPLNLPIISLFLNS